MDIAKRVNSTRRHNLNLSIRKHKTTIKLKKKKKKRNEFFKNVIKAKEWLWSFHIEGKPEDMTAKVNS